MQGLAELCGLERLHVYGVGADRRLLLAVVAISLLRLLELPLVLLVLLQLVLLVFWGELVLRPMPSLQPTTWVRRLDTL